MLWHFVMRKDWFPDDWSSNKNCLVSLFSVLSLKISFFQTISQHFNLDSFINWMVNVGNLPTFFCFACYSSVINKSYVRKELQVTPFSSMLNLFGVAQDYTAILCQSVETNFPDLFEYIEYKIWSGSVVI